MKFTDSQRKAVETQDVNLTLSAGAGSGKTTVLVSRYMNFLANEKNHIKDILAITFTNKSAADMRVKIREHIAKEIKINQGENISYWKGVKDQFEQATISTIHGFALQVLRSFPLESKINPESSLMDEVESKILLTDTIREIIREYYQDESMQILVQTIKSTENTINLLAAIYQKIRSLGCSIESVSEQALSQKVIIAERVENAKITIVDLFEELDQVVSAYSGSAKFAIRYNETNRETIIKGLVQATDYQDYEFNIARNDVKELLKSPIKDAKEIVDEIKERVEDIKQGLAFLEAVPLYELLEGVFREIDESYSKNKRAQRLLDYSDLEWGLLNLLEEDENVRKYYQQKYKYVLVDEFQDTSPLQQKLIRLLSPYDKNGLFIVGDPRQSIYRFRAAELAGFIEMTEEIVSHQGLAINLAENFRSKPNLIHFQNDFFGYLFGQSELDYQDVLVGKNEKDKETRVKLLLLKQEEVTEEMNTSDLRRLEAKYIAHNIKELNQKGVGFKDIAILFRAMTDVKMYELALAEQDIPYQVTGSKGFFEKQEIVDLFNLLEYFADSSNEIMLLGLLRSPFYSFSDEDLYCIRESKEMIKSPLATDARENYQKAITDLSRWRQKLTLENLSDCLEEFVLAKDYKASLLVSEDYGKQAAVNVNKFVALLRSLEATNTTSLEDILKYLNVMRQGNALMGEAKVSEEINSVQLMSIHQSKGLEFNTVIIPQLERRLIMPPSDMVCFTKEHGLVIRTRGYSDKTQNNYYYNLMKEHEEFLELEEAYRLFYVATTRAEERLILSTAKPKLGRKKSTYFDYLAEYLELSEVPKEKIDLKGLIEVIPQSIIESKLVEKKERDIPLPEFDLLKQIDYQANTNLFLSATALMIHSECPREYYYRYIKSIPEFKGKSDQNYNASELGTIIHKVCEVMEDTNGYQLLDTLLTMVNKPESVKKRYQVEGREMIDNYLQSREYGLIKSADQVRSEIMFNIAINDKILTGVIDKFIINKGKLSILDLKTGIMSRKQIKKYELQNAVYALAISKTYGLYPDALISYFMSESKSQDYIEKLPTYESSLELVMESLETLDVDLANKKFSKRLDSCQNCVYLNLCKRNEED